MYAQGELEHAQPLPEQAREGLAHCRNTRFAAAYNCNGCSNHSAHTHSTNNARDAHTQSMNAAAKRPVFCCKTDASIKETGPRVLKLGDFIKAPLNILTNASEVNAIGASRGQSEVRIKITSDSGAAARVMPAGLLQAQVGTKRGASEGMLYSAAGPTTKPIKNVGQRVIRGVTEQGARLQLPFEAVDNITKPLASVSKMVDAGQAVLYHPSGSAIFDLRAKHNKELKDILGGHKH